MADNQKNPNGFSPRTGGTNKKKRKLNKDGVLALVFLALIVVIIVAIIIIMVNAISGKNNNQGSTDPRVPIQTNEPGSSSTTPVQPSNTPTGTPTSPSGTTEPVTPPAEGYGTITLAQSEIYTGDLLLVNNQYRYRVPDAKQSRLVSLYNQAGFRSVYRLKNAHVALNVDIIFDFANMLGSLKASFANKSLSSDVLLIQNAAVVNDPASVPASSDENSTGLSFDIKVYITSGELAGKIRRLNEDEQKWLADNCAAYGFILRYGEGKSDITGKETDLYHFRYVGIPHSTYMKANNLCLEEYIDLLKTQTYDRPLKVTAGGASYEVYYVKSTGAVTTANVQNGADYTVSGNNVDGFIITVKK